MELRFPLLLPKIFGRGHCFVTSYLVANSTMLSTLGVFVCLFVGFINLYSNACIWQNFGRLWSARIHSMEVNLCHQSLSFSFVEFLLHRNQNLNLKQTLHVDCFYSAISTFAGSLIEVIYCNPACNELNTWNYLSSSLWNRKCTSAVD